MSDFRSVVLQQVASHRKSQQSNHGPTGARGLIATPDAQAYAPFASTFGTVSSLFLVNGPVCLDLKDAAESMGADSNHPHASTARAAQALVQSGTKKAVRFLEAESKETGEPVEIEVPESEDEDDIAPQSARAMAQRAFSVAASVWDSSTPSAGIVMDPASGLPIAILGSPVWMRLAGENPDTVGQDISSSGTLPARIMWMPRQQALEMSAAKGSIEAQAELSRQASRTAANIPSPFNKKTAGRSTASVAAAASQTDYDLPSPHADESGSLSGGQPRQIAVRRPVDHPGSPIMLDCMHALLRQARGETKRAVSVTHSYLPVANGLPIAARLTIEFVNFKTPGNFPVVMVRGDTSPLANPLDQLLPDATSFHLRALGASRAQLSYAAGMLTGQRQASLPRRGLSSSGVQLHPALAAFMQHLEGASAPSKASVRCQQLPDNDDASGQEVASDGTAGGSRTASQTAVQSEPGVQRAASRPLLAAAAALQGRGGTKRSRHDLDRRQEHPALLGPSSASSQAAADGEWEQSEAERLQPPSKAFRGDAYSRALALNRMLGVQPASKDEGN